MEDKIDKWDEIIKRTGAGTEAFNKNMKKRMVFMILLIGSYISLVSFALLWTTYLSNNPATRLLNGYILLFGVIIILLGLISILVIGIQWYAYDRLAKSRSNTSKGS